MAGKGTISISFRIDDGKDGLKNLTVDAKALRAVLEENARAAQQAQSRLFQMAAATTTFRGLDDVFSQLSDGLNNLTAEAESFDAAMRAANTMAGKDATGFRELSSDVADLAKRVPIARDALANGLYQTISNGVPEGNWVAFLEKSARSAVGGMADLGQVVGVTSTLIKNYGLEWDDAGAIQDKIQLTAKNGVTSFEQLAAALPRVAGNAATLGVSIDELMATFATLTGVSGNTAEVSTQLAAIFTALIKPSSEATEMAGKMGIQFSAAAIQASGGFSQFLRNLDASVKSYASAHGMLEQEIYGKLFGSAESLRALVPLQGELADSFRANIATMRDSAGTMDAAFADMASTGESKIQLLKNMFAGLGDMLNRWLGPLKPALSGFAQFAQAAASVAILANTMRQLNVQQALFALRAKATATATALMSGQIKLSTIAVTAMKVALRGLMITAGIGLAIMALTWIIEKFVNAADKATDAADGLGAAGDRMQDTANRIRQTEDAAAESVKGMRAQLELDIKATREFCGTKEQERSLIDQLNQRYGATMGYFSSVSAWYKALTANSEAYCRQMIIEARTRMYADQLAELDKEYDEILYNPDGSAKKYSKARPGDEFINLSGRSVRTRRELIAKYTAKDWMLSEDGMQLFRPSDFDKAKSDANANRQRYHAIEDRMKQKTDITSMPVMGDSNQPKNATATTKTGRGGNNKDDKEKLNLLQQIEKQIRDNEEAALTADEAQMKSLRESTQALVKQRDELRAKQATLTAAPEYTPPQTDRIKTYEELDKALQHYNDKLRKAQPEERAEIDSTIKKLEAMRDAWDKALNPEPPQKSDLDNYIDSLSESATAKFKSMASPLKGMDPQQLVSGLREIENVLAGMDGDITAEQRASLQAAAEEYRKYIATASRSMDTMLDGWNAVKGIGSGIESITSALEGNGNAWQTVTGIIDGFIQIYQGVMAVIGIIDLLCTATTTAKATETTATATAATAEVAANKLATGSYLELAAAKYLAAHAGIPFAGYGIGSGFAASAAALVKSLGFTGAFAEGGIVGGTSWSGDRVPVRVNSGEMILNTRQQRRLFALLNAPGRAMLSDTRRRMAHADLRGLADLAAPSRQTVTFRVSGRDLVGVIANETRIAAKSGRRTDIKI